MIDQNALQGWMNFYRQNGLGPPDYGPGDSFGGAGLGMNQNQGALQFALRMAQQGQQPSTPGYVSQNFFAGLPGAPSFVTPQPFNPGARPAAGVSPANFLALMVKR